MLTRARSRSCGSSSTRVWLRKHLPQLRLPISQAHVQQCRAGTGVRTANNGSQFSGLFSTDEVSHALRVLFPGRPVLGPSELLDAATRGVSLPAYHTPYLVIGYAHSHFLTTVVDPASATAHVMDSIPNVQGTLSAAGSAVSDHVRIAFRNTYGRQIKSVLVSPCEKQHDGFSCALHSLRNAALWLAGQPFLMPADSSPVLWAQLARMAAVINLQRSSQCPCEDCRPKRAVSLWRRLATALGQRGLPRHGSDEREVVVPTSWVRPVMGPNLKPCTLALYEALLPFCFALQPPAAVADVPHAAAAAQPPGDSAQAAVAKHTPPAAAAASGGTGRAADGSAPSPPQPQVAATLSRTVTFPRPGVPGSVDVQPADYETYVAQSERHELTAAHFRSNRCRLQNGRMLNDSIIDFLLANVRLSLPPGVRTQRAAVETRLTPTSRQARIRIFNAFFYKALRGLDLREGPGVLPAGASRKDKAAAAHARVARWTPFNLFDGNTDYVIIPIGGSSHWTMSVIAHPASVVPLTVREDDSMPSFERKDAAIIHMDSLTTYHQEAGRHLRDWLAAEYAAKKGCSLDSALASFTRHSIPYLRPQVPQQTNGVDCGLFAAEFARRFCLNAPAVFRLEMYPYFMKADWFAPTAAGAFRRHHARAQLQSLAGNGPMPEPLPLPRLDDCGVVAAERGAASLQNGGVFAWLCGCGALTEHPLAECMAQRHHDGKRKYVMKRYFACRECRQVTFTLDMTYPSRCCVRCRSHDFDLLKGSEQVVSMLIDIDSLEHSASPTVCAAVVPSLESDTPPRDRQDPSAVKPRKRTRADAIADALERAREKANDRIQLLEGAALGAAERAAALRTSALRAEEQLAAHQAAVASRIALAATNQPVTDSPAPAAPSQIQNTPNPYPKTPNPNPNPNTPIQNPIELNNSFIQSEPRHNKEPEGANVHVTTLASNKNTAFETPVASLSSCPGADAQAGASPSDAVRAGLESERGRRAPGALVGRGARDVATPSKGFRPGNTLQQHQRQLRAQQALRSLFADTERRLREQARQHGEQLAARAAALATQADEAEAQARRAESNLEAARQERLSAGEQACAAVPARPQHRSGLAATHLAARSVNFCQSSVVETAQRRRVTAGGINEQHRLDLGRMDQACEGGETWPGCGAAFWERERNSVGLYKTCCDHGDVRLPPRRPFPEPLRSLVHNRAFRAAFRSYQAAFQCASTGLKDKTLSGGVASFTVQGRLYHQLSTSAQPGDSGGEPTYLQVYTLDDQAAAVRRGRLLGQANLNADILSQLTSMMSSVNPYVGHFKALANSETPTARLILQAATCKSHMVNGQDSRTYSLPTASEVAVLITGAEDEQQHAREVIVHKVAAPPGQGYKLQFIQTRLAYTGTNLLHQADSNARTAQPRRFHAAALHADVSSR